MKTLLGALIFALSLMSANQVLRAAPPNVSPDSPRGYGYISARIFGFFLDRAVEESAVVRENVLGASTEGIQTTRARLQLSTLNNTRQAVFDLRLAGQCRCEDNVSYRGPATILGNSTTDFEAHLRLVLHDDQFSVAQVNANSDTQTEIEDVQTRLPIVERVAWRLAHRKLPQVEQEVSRLVEERLAQRLRDEISKLAGEANEAIAEQAKKPLVAAGAWPRMKYSTTPGGLNFAVYSAPGARRIETPRPPDWMNRSDLGVCIHESLLEQMVERLLGGHEVRDEQILYVVELLTGTAPRPLWVHDRAERWSVVLAKSRPVEIAFRDNGLHVVINVAETVRGKDRSKFHARISSSFDVDPQVDGLALRRRGGLDVEFTGVTNVDAPPEAARRKFLTTKFNAIFPDEFHFDTLAPPAGGFGTKMRHVRPEVTRFENGWATIAYRLHSTPVK